ncbi:MAG: TonB-dependent receptor [Flavobacterium sp.]|nr:TonB-dependent receptor [Flavobacterium sp.]
MIFLNLSRKSAKTQSRKTQHFSKSKIFNFLFAVSISIFSVSSFAQQKDSTAVNQLDEVLVSAVRVTKKTPVSFSNLDKREIKFRNLGQDIPILMNFLPSVVTTSDAGNGVGYTGIRVRGSDATRVNVTINGIPYNDAEGSGTYFVDLPDFASSLESLQLQRGVGTSTNGAGAFGASLNMLTDAYAKNSNGEISNSYGSFNTKKSTVKFSTGLLNDHFELAGRLSKIASDGYVNRGASNLKSYFLQGTYVGKTTLIKALVFGGTEKTYQSWYGIDGETLNNDRTYNGAGIFTDAFGNTRFYENQTDNYQQDHYQLHWNEKISSHWNTNVALHYTNGKGYYENYIQGGNSFDYGLSSFETSYITDLINQKWLDNDFYGTTFSANYKNEKTDFILGGGINEYKGLHYGKVIWARNTGLSELGDHYYDNYGNKFDANFFAKINYQISKKISLYADLQYRNVNYKANGVQANLVNDTFNFLNPKAGLNYTVNQNNSLYFSYAKANREPNRTDYESGSPKPEKLDDYELGWRLVTEKVKLNTNVYLMNYKNQLILTGNLDNVGNPIRSNSEKSYRLGLEIDALITVSKHLTIRPNFTVSQNKNVNLEVTGENYGTKDIAYSPSYIAGNILTYQPLKSLQLSVLSKFVGSQYLNNIESENAKLADYFVNDFNLSYEIKPKSIFKSIVFSGIANNFLNKKYVSNGYMYDIYPYYYPQAGTNFLVGMTLKL